MEKLLWCAFFILAVSACSVAESRSDLDTLIVDGAYNTHRVKLEHPAVTQVSYDINIKYPGVAITTEKVKLLKQQGWHQCEQDKARWEHFGDYSVTPRQLIHQYQLNFAKDKELITISMRYLSALPSADPSESKPDNATQHVIILHYDLSVEEVRLQMGGQAESCLRHK